MRRTASMLAIAAIGLLVLAPAIADARPGGSSSSGSRGSRTYAAPPPTNTAPNAAQPMQRTQQPAPGPQQAAPGAAARPGAAAAAPSRGFGGAMMAGLLGAGIFGLLLGAGAFGNLGSFAAILGLLLQLALIGGLVALIVMLVRRRAQPQPAGMPRQMMQDAPPAARAGFGGGGMLGGSAAARPVDEIGITPADQQAFGQALVEINRAWSAQDVPALQRLATPEMMSFFREDGLALEARGWRNETRDIRLEQADVSEAWNEGARDYATVALKFSLIDVTIRVSDGAVMEGSPTERQTTTELWTFVRVQGGPWMLSAIQQTG